jgi:hypothetical protein
MATLFSFIGYLWLSLYTLYINEYILNYYSNTTNFVSNNDSDFIPIVSGLSHIDDQKSYWQELGYKDDMPYMKDYVNLVAVKDGSFFELYMKKDGDEDWVPYCYYTDKGKWLYQKGKCK